MKRLKLLLQALIIALFFQLTAAIDANAQNWNYLRDSIMREDTTAFATERFEDVYFTSLTTGFAINLRGRIFKTTNGGYSWAVKTDTSLREGFRSIEFLNDGQYGIAGTLDGKTFRTTDAGETWTDISASIIDTEFFYGKRICGLAHYGNTFWGVGWWGSNNAKIYKSTDKGQSWQTTYMDTSLVNSLVDVLFLSADTGFITGKKKNSAVVLKTTNGGISWTTVFSDNTIGGRVWKIQSVIPNMLVGSIEPYYFQDTVAMIKSVDGGNSWSIIGAGSIHSPYVGTQGIGFVTPMKGWLGGYYGGIFETIDGGQTWQKLNFGQNFNRFFVLDSNNVYAGGKLVYKYGPVPGHQTGVAPEPKPIPAPHILYPISPNPAKSETVKIEFDLKNETNVVLEVAGIDSRRVWQVENKRLKAGHYTYSWNGSNAANGMYMIWLGTDEIPIVQKFVLNK